MLGTSNRTPGRAGLGFHYIHLETGLLYLNATLKVIKAYPGCMRGSGQGDDHFMRHGLYFIMKDKNSLPPEKEQFASIFSKDDILAT